jgi:hypothetical protein
LQQQYGRVISNNKNDSNWNSSSNSNNSNNNKKTNKNKKTNNSNNNKNKRQKNKAKGNFNSNSNSDSNNMNNQSSESHGFTSQTVRGVGMGNNNNSNTGNNNNESSNEDDSDEGDKKPASSTWQPAQDDGNNSNGRRDHNGYFGASVQTQAGVRLDSGPREVFAPAACQSVMPVAVNHGHVQPRQGGQLMVSPFAVPPPNHQYCSPADYGGPPWYPRAPQPQYGFGGGYDSPAFAIPFQHVPVQQQQYGHLVQPPFASVQQQQQYGQPIVGAANNQHAFSPVPNNQHGHASVISPARSSSKSG